MRYSGLGGDEMSAEDYKLPPLRSTISFTTHVTCVKFVLVYLISHLQDSILFNRLLVQLARERTEVSIRNCIPH